MKTLIEIITLLTFVILVWQFILKNFFYGLKVELLDPVWLPDQNTTFEFIPVIVSNRGSKPLKITEVYLCNPETKDGLFFMTYEIPYFLESGSTKVFFFDKDFQIDYQKKEKYTKVHVQYNFKRKDIVANMKTLKGDEKIASDISLVAAYKQHKEKELKERPPVSM